MVEETHFAKFAATRLPESITAFRAATGVEDFSSVRSVESLGNIFLQKISQNI